MFANEDSMLEYFYEYGEALSIYQLEEKFDNSPREEILEVVTALEKKNQVKYITSALWAITEKGIAHFEYLRRSKNTTAPTNEAIKTLKDIIIAIIVAVIAGYLVYKFGWN